MFESKLKVIKALQTATFQGKLTNPRLIGCLELKPAKEQVESWEAILPSTAQEFIEFLANEYISHLPPRKGE